MSSKQARYQKTDKGKATQRRHQQTEKGKATSRKGQRKWANANRHKTRAHGAVATALKRGDLVRPNVCEHCGDHQFTEASHTDYEKQLEVEWLCRPCHMRKDGSAR